MFCFFLFVVQGGKIESGGLGLVVVFDGNANFPKTKREQASQGLKRQWKKGYSWGGEVVRGGGEN